MHLQWVRYYLEFTWQILFVSKNRKYSLKKKGLVVIKIIECHKLLFKEKNSLMFKLIDNFYCISMKHKTLYNCLCSSSGDSVSVIWNIKEFGAKNYFSDHWKLIQYMVLEVSSSPENTRLLLGYQNWSNFPFIFKYYNARTVCWCKQPTSSSS